MFEIIRREAIYIWYYFSIQFEQIFWYWLLGMALGSIVSVFAKDKIHALFTSLREKKLGIFGLVPAALLGIASPLCMYGTIPIVASFAAINSNSNEKRIGEDWLAAFMMSSILLNPQLLFYTAALGTPALVIRLVSCFLCGIAAGLAIRFLFKGKRFFNFSGFYNGDNRCDMHGAGQRDHFLLLLFRSFGRNIKATGLYFLIGILLSALFQRYVPQEAFARLFGSGNRGFGLLMAATVGVPLYVCGGGTIPLLQSWLHSGMSMGGAAAFMITGPAAKITNLGALKIVLGIKHFLLYLAFAVVFAIVTGALVNLIF
ncbi:MAG: permease [Treponema sp.]|nr:permease [Treponema sp.]